MHSHNFLIDAREFVPDYKTGIGRFLESLLSILARAFPICNLSIALHQSSGIPAWMIHSDRVKVLQLPKNFLRSELFISRLSRSGYHLLISPYPKLPLFGTGCPSIHTVHDIIDLVGPFRTRLFRRTFDSWRLKAALRAAALTWYVSSWSMRETRQFMGTAGKNPMIRYNGIGERFVDEPDLGDPIIRTKYRLSSGYILVLGNGKPHKNLAVVLRLADHTSRPVVFSGVSACWRAYWTKGISAANVRWLEQVTDRHLPAIIRGAYCLMQPSIAEGFGYPPLEAMACGIPVIVSDIPVLRETTGGKAIYADPTTTASWLKAIALLEDTQIYQRQSIRGLAWVRQFKGAQAWAGHLADIEGLLPKNTFY